jgi:16S rRNA (cytidine1402-2'-O)-methyltransferase
LSQPSSPIGTLYVVATPIGNLDDITARALRTLESVTGIAAEDTRRTRALLTHFGIRGKRLYALDAHAGVRSVERVAERLLAGDDVALVSDAGTPAVSDPGAALVQAAAARGARVVAVPGASAATAAISVSGLVESAFWFVGFLPRGGGKRKEMLRRIERSDEPVVLLEAPTRIAETLAELATLMPTRAASLSRELTKLHEETLRGTLSELSAVEREWRGELTLVLGVRPEGSSRQTAAAPEASELELRIVTRLREGGRTRAIAGELSELYGIPRRDAYARVQSIKNRLAGE